MVEIPRLYYDLKVHIVWITKYRKKVLKGDVSHRVRELIREICKANEVEIIKGHVSVDHIHLLVSYPPSLSISKLVQYVKGKTSRRLLQDYTELRKMFWGQHLWARGLRNKMSLQRMTTSRYLNDFRSL